MLNFHRVQALKTLFLDLVFKCFSATLERTFPSFLGGIPGSGCFGRCSGSWRLFRVLDVPGKTKTNMPENGKFPGHHRKQGKVNQIDFSTKGSCYQ